MSYILGALRKAEKERKGDIAQQQSDVEWDARTWDSEETNPAVGIPWLKFALITVVCLFLVVSCFLWVWNKGGQFFLASSSQFSEKQLESIQTHSEIAQGEVGSPVTVIEDVSEEVGKGRDLGLNGREAKPTVSDAPHLPQITGHLYVPTNQSLSRIFSDAGSFRVGHVFENGLVLESISESQATFGWRGRAYQIELRE